MNLIGIHDASPELVEKAKKRTKQLGFTNVSDYLIYLIMADKSVKARRSPRNKIQPVGFEFILNTEGVVTMAGMMLDVTNSSLGNSADNTYSLEEIYNAMRDRFSIVTMAWDEMNERNRDDLAVQFKRLVEDSPKSPFEKLKESSGGYSKYKYIREDKSTGRLTAGDTINTLDESAVDELVSNLNDMGSSHFEDLLYQLYDMELIYETYRKGYEPTLPTWVSLSSNTQSLIEGRFKEVIDDTDSNFDISKATKDNKPLYLCERDNG